ncbi:hypothetical protein LR48_Vigan10g103000 [Vigna angularis]|uniref:Protein DETOXIFICATION n=1 Tax=Phaseolus angularis TaxID=3914 RepID=A0A0L9VJH8_PHAAN|nr:hypothetical protein LR48_Vigan10g103000 [Vigna angularis]
METPLVPRKFSAEADYLAMKGWKDAKFVFWTETVKIWRIAFPMALSALFQLFTLLSNSVYAGHLGDLELSSISVYQGVLGSIYFYLLGLWGGTLCGRALQILVLLVIIWKTNWSKEVEQTAHRMRIWRINNHLLDDMGNVT